MAAALAQDQPSHSVAQVSADGVLVMIDPALHGEQSLTAARVIDPASLSNTGMEFRPFPELWHVALPDWAPTEAAWLELEVTTAEGAAIEALIYVDPHATVLGPVRSGQTLWRLARQQVEAAADLGDDQRSAGDWVRRLHELNPAAFEDGAIDRLRQGALLLTDPVQTRPIFGAEAVIAPATKPVVDVPVVAALPAVTETEAEAAIEWATAIDLMPATEPAAPAPPAPQAELAERVSARAHYSPINPLTGVAGTAVILVMAVLALAKAWRRRRRSPPDVEARLAAQFAQRGHADIARAWWAEALLKADTEAQRQTLRSALRAESGSTTR